MTLRRIRHFQSKWKGQSVDQVPFSLHAIKFLLAIIDGETDLPKDPYDAPWMSDSDPNRYGEWLEQYRKNNEGKFPQPREYTEADKPLHNAIEEAGPHPENMVENGGFLPYDHKEPEPETPEDYRQSDGGAPELPGLDDFF